MILRAAYKPSNLSLCRSCRFNNRHRSPVRLSLSVADSPSASRAFVLKSPKPFKQDQTIRGAHSSIRYYRSESTMASAPAESTCDASDGKHDEWNRVADHMDYFHNIFRQKWTIMHTALENKQRPRNMTQDMFFNFAIEFCRGLTMHHNIEEAHVFPMLATRMPAFKDQAIMKEHHKKIHEGLDKFEEYVKDCKAGRKEFESDKMLSLMDSFGDVLWTHLDEEVKQLGGENMRKYWKLEELSWIM